MPTKFMSKVSWIVATMFIAAIIISFALTGVGSSRYSGSGKVIVAKVDGTPIEIDEYQRVLQSQLDYYSKIMGGKSLSTKDIELFGIRKRAIQQLVEQKLLLNLSDDIKLTPSKKEVQYEIAERPYFKTNGRFDFNKYKQLLQANRFSPIDFESKIAEELKFKKVGMLLGSQQISSNFLKDLITYKDMKANASVIKLYKDNLKKFIKVDPAKVAAFIADPKNEGRLKALYDANKAEYNIEESVKASHILVKIDNNDAKAALDKIQKIRKELTVANFAQLANKYTQDPSGKGKGGSLGSFKRGVMDPAFEKKAFSMKSGTISDPVKSSFGYHIIYVQKHNDAKLIAFEDAKKDLAEDVIRTEDRKQLERLSNMVGGDLKSALAKNKGIHELKEKYSFLWENGKTVNRLDGRVGSIELDEEQMKQLFDDKGAKLGTFLFDRPNHLLVVKMNDFKKKPNENNGEDQLKNEENIQKYQIARKVRENIMKSLQENASVKVYSSML